MKHKCAPRSSGSVSSAAGQPGLSDDKRAWGKGEREKSSGSL